jgi:hypothetical protein
VTGSLLLLLIGIAQIFHNYFNYDDLFTKERFIICLKDFVTHTGIFGLSVF